MGRQKLDRHAIVAGVRDFCEQETLRLMPLVERIARKSGLPDPPFRLEDLIQEGALACFEHLPRYDPRMTNAQGQPIKVETFLYPRIWGAMKDFARRTGRFLHGGARTGRKEQILSLAAEIQGSSHGERPVTVADVLIDEQAESPSAKALARSAWQAVLRGFNQRERILVLEYFVHGRTLKSISQDLGLSESRCLQMLTRILAALRASDAAGGRVRENLAA